MQNHRSLSSARDSSHLGAIGTSVPSVAPTSSSASTTKTEQSLAARVEQALRHDHERSALLRDLYYQCQALSQEVGRLTKEKETLANRELALSNAMMSNPFVLVLIDGDGMVFSSELIREGEMGGRRAAAQLQTAIASYIEQDTKDLPLDHRVVCRIYANVKGLAEVLVRAGVIDDSTQFEEFARGFTRGNVLFDFIDVGPGKDRADVKVIDSLKLFLRDYHCRQIFFGCSHGNGFARLLEQYIINTDYVAKITLLEGVPFEKELPVLPYKTTRFAGLFRDSKICINGSWPDAPAVKGHISNKSLRIPPTERPRTPLVDSAHHSPNIFSAKPDLYRTTSWSTTGSESAPAVKPASSWAAKAAAPPPVVSSSPDYVPASRHEGIHHNRLGQRVDPQCRDYDKAEVERVKKLKLCNTHFLLGKCPYGNKCGHLHNYEPSQAEIETLRLVARMAACQYGTDCKDIKCIYGHRCFAPPGKTPMPKGTKNCIFGEACKFPDELHDVDCKIVKTLVIR